MPSPTTIIIVPCYNESSRLRPAQFITYLENDINTKFLFVDDCSTDNTVDILQQLCQSVPERISFISLLQNGGKAEAVRQGVLRALNTTSQQIGFWDADLATPLAEIPRFSSLLAAPTNLKMICGSRIKRLGANIERKWFRHYFGRVIATLISMILKLPTYDTQCGAKLFEQSLAEKIFTKPFLSSWLFDVELFARTIEVEGRENAIEMIYELPLKSWRDIGASKISLCYLPKIPWELTRIRFHYREILK